MKRMIVVLPLLLLGLLLVSDETQADPVSTFTASHPTQYEDGRIIPSTDVLKFTIYCGTNAVGPYPFSFSIASLESGASVDVSSCVLGSPGVYYFVATATSAVYGTESIFSNEVVRTYTASDLGKTPLAPTLFTIS